MRLSRLLLPAGIVLAGFGVGYVQPMLRTSASVPSPEPRTAAGTQVVLAYIGASTCGPSNHEDLPDWFAAIRDSVTARASERGQVVVTLGVGREYDVAAGLKHLARMGQFDEIAVGQREANQVSLRLISRDFPGVAATPQLLVIERTFPALPLGGVDHSDVKETLLIRRVGTEEIRRWLEMGVPLPRASRDSVRRLAEGKTQSE